MDVIPQSTPLYATVKYSDVVYQVIGWSRDTDNGHSVCSPIAVPLFVSHAHAEAKRSATLYPTLEEAQAALLSR